MPLINKHNQQFYLNREDLYLLEKYNWTIPRYHLRSDGTWYYRMQRSHKKSYGVYRMVYIQHDILNVLPWELGIKMIDHIDENPLNNKRENLRLVTKSENMKNTKQHKQRRGVSFHIQSGKWVAYYINGFGTQKHLGSFKTENEALAIAAKANGVSIC